MDFLESCRRAAPAPLPDGLDGTLRYTLALESRQDGFCDLSVQAGCVNADDDGSRFVLSPESIRQFRDPADQAILAALYGAWRPVEPDTTGIGSPFRLWGAVAEKLIPMLIGTGRLLLPGEDDVIESDCQVRMDEDSKPWTLGLTVERNGDGGALDFRGVLVRRAESMSLSHAELSPDGWLVSGYTLARYEGDPLWLRFLLSRKRFSVSLGDLKDFFLQLGTLGHWLPACSWPQGMAAPFVKGCNPVPELSLTAPYLKAVGRGP